MLASRIDRTDVLIVVPPNTNTVIDGRLLTVTRPEEHSDWSDFMSLGTLGMACAVRNVPGVHPVYIDGTVIDLDEILDLIASNHRQILAVCIGVLTANYEAGLLILAHTKKLDPEITTVIGNDHFTALPAVCIKRADLIDYGFFGNEVVGPFSRLIADLRHAKAIEMAAYPSLVSRNGDSVHIAGPKPEPVFTDYDYGLVDDAFTHSKLYARGFEKRIAPRVKQLLSRDVRAGVPVDIGRGCIKFAKNQACSFCSIQYGGLWKNSLSAPEAWRAIERAWLAGFDYLYITADELPLTFGPLLSAMSEVKPAWWNDLSKSERPMLVGYARADGIAEARRTRRLLDIGVRQVMIGMDAGSGVSLAAMNKPLRDQAKDLVREGDALWEQNSRAIRVARNEGMLIRAGFVLGHVGMTRDLLRVNVEMIMDLISIGRDVISAIDIEVLSPQPGSFDFNYLTTPSDAIAAAERVGLEVADASEVARVAARWRGEDIIEPEQAMRDYVSVLMPELEFSELAESRAAIRNFAKECGVVVGE